MLAYRFRFHGYGSLRYLHQHGRTVRSRMLAVRFIANPKRRNSRAAVVITRKVLKPAPGRNRVRRRLFEILRTNWQHIKPGHDMLLSVYDPGLHDMPHDELQHMVIDLLRRADLWQDDTASKKTRIETL